MQWIDTGWNVVGVHTRLESHVVIERSSADGIDLTECAALGEGREFLVHVRRGSLASSPPRLSLSSPLPLPPLLPPAMF